MTDQQKGQAGQDRLRAWLEFYEELGLTPFYRRAATPAATREHTPILAAAKALAESSSVGRAPSAPLGTSEAVPSRSLSSRAAAPTTAATVSALPFSTPQATLSLFGEAPGRVEGETLEQIGADLGDCQRCPLSRHRTHIVFGTGNPNAHLVFVGEAPGHEEDMQGLPFVGRAGQLLTHWIESLGMKREEVYICNVIKCRPPGNRSPEKDEIDTCSPFLIRQLDAIRPKLICCLGSVAVQTLLGKAVSITRMRGRFFEWRGMKLFATFHPAYLLRNPNANRQVQDDLRTIRQFLA